MKVSSRSHFVDYYYIQKDVEKSRNTCCYYMIIIAARVILKFCRFLKFL